LADDLNRLTEQADLRPPFILAPSSLGGVTVEMFARLHPEKVAGLVFVDAANSGLMDAATRRFSKLQLSSICLAEPAARFGVLRALDPFGLREDGENGARSISRLYRVEPMHTLCGLARSAEATREEFRVAPPLAADMPLMVLIHDRTDGFLPAMLARSAFLRERIASFNGEWLRLQRQFAQSSSRGAWRVVPGSGHLIAAEQPHAVAAAVLALMNEVGTVRGK
jgi:pimeloyl-ACP methyl ester carboxylesterase